MSKFRYVPPALLALALSGCGIATPGKPFAATPLPAAMHLHGRVRGGQQPVAGASIQFYAVATTADGAPSTALLASPAVTDANGNFDITNAYTCPSAGALTYITATGGNPGLSGTNSAIALMTALGTCGPLSAATTVEIDERTTVAAIAALAPFMRNLSSIGSSSVDAAGLSTAFTYAQSLVDPSTGSIPGPALPANAVAPAQTIDTLADILATCVNTAGGTAGDSSPCGQLFTLTTPTGAAAPADTSAAALNLMRDPVTNAAAIYNLSAATAPFQPQLSSAPASFQLALSGSGTPPAAPIGCTGPDLTGANVFTNFMLEQAGVCRFEHASDLPAPNTSASNYNYPTQVARAAGQLPIVPPGFQITVYATGSFNDARFLLPAANGDLLLGEQTSGNIWVIRGVDANGAAISSFYYTHYDDQIYGLAFYPSAANPQYLYFTTPSSILRYPYALGDIQASGAATTLATDLPTGGLHSTRTLAFTKEATPRLLVSVGSYSNDTNTDTDTTDEVHRADVLAYSPDGVFQSIYASGLRNAVGLTLDASGTPWVSVNERDGLGDNLAADFVTHIVEGGFYGWPWYYNGPNPDPNLPVDHPELAAQTIIGDTLLQAHFAPLQIAFYTGTNFPASYRGDLFVTSHGSFNKAVPGGYEVLRARMQNGVATGEYEDFVTGFMNPDGTYWGRPTGIATGLDGALYICDDGSNSIWRVTYTGN